jgi:ABC-type amino acid transport substrate-binding protein
LILLAFILVACRSEPESTTPTLDTTELATTPEATSAEEVVATSPAGEAAITPSAWAQVQERGRLIVGTSADYPPFASYDEAFELTGYDIALARLLGERLGVEVEFNDMAFDGLGGALQVGQLDAAIAAISVTDQRREHVDFSTVYYVSEGAALARADSTFTVNQIEDLAAHRVGVQQGTVYQTWLQESGVDAGLLPVDNLLVYITADEALNDLRAGLIDVVIADRLPLEVATRDGALRIAGQGLNRQRFAVALARGSTLLSPINQALFDLQNDGSLAELASQYLDLEEAEIQPLLPAEATPEATGEPAATRASCVNAMSLVAHLSLDDDGMRSPPPVSPGTPFQKTWRIQNNGTCPWTTGYALTFVGGNVPQASMGGSATPIQPTVAPGETYDVTVNLVAPLVPGVYQGFWTMRSPDGLLFGERIWVGITVPAQPTPTPPPTTVPSPDVRFNVDRTPINAGECVTFTWEVSNGGSVFFSAQGQPWESHPVASSGSQRECPPVTTAYDLRVLLADGTTDLHTIRIEVRPSPEAPFFESFSVTPSQQIVFGQCVDVRWRITGDVTNIRVVRNDTVLWNNAPLNGTSRDCPPVGVATYSIEATGPGGASHALENVTVLSSSTAPPAGTATPGGQLPIINSFTVVPERLLVGQCLTVAWNVSGNVNRVQLRRNNVLVLDFALFTGSITDCLATEGSYVYRIDATNPSGGTAFSAVTVTVVR